MAAISNNNDGRFDPRFDVSNANPASDFRARVFGSREQCLLHYLMREGKQR
jgi:hypothetical protein